jgi:hypothetical protein
MARIAFVQGMVPPARSAQRWNTPLSVTLHGRVTPGVRIC